MRMFLKTLARNWLETASVLFLVLLAFPIVESWYRSHQRDEAARVEREALQAAERSKKEATQAIGVDAEATAAALWAAQSDCQKIDIFDLSACSTWNAQLPQEIAARTLAVEAIAKRLAYDFNCSRTQTIDYCSSLISRAWYLKSKNQRK